MAGGAISVVFDEVLHSAVFSDAVPLSFPWPGHRLPPIRHAMRILYSLKGTGQSDTFRSFKGRLA
jgi:hypothetical protein